MARRHPLLPLMSILLALSVPLPLHALPPTSGSEADTASPSELGFRRLQSLAGRWRATSTKGWSEEVVIEVIARGSVVMSTTLFEEGRKMVTMYSLDGDDLVATHYCEARNQPHLVASEIATDASSLLFTFVRAGNLRSRDQGHMDSARLHFLDDDRFSSRWTWYQDGAESWMEEIEYRRIR